MPFMLRITYRATIAEQGYTRTSYGLCQYGTVDSSMLPVHESGPFADELLAETAMGKILAKEDVIRVELLNTGAL